MKFHSPCKCGQFEPRVTSVTSRQVRRQGARKYEPVNVTVCRNCGRHETLEFRASRRRLFDLVKSMTGFTRLEDDISEIEQAVLSYASESKT